MEKIKKRIMDAVKNLQLAENEMSRLGIVGKSVKLDADATSMLQMLSKLSAEIKSISDQIH